MNILIEIVMDILEAQKVCVFTKKNNAPKCRQYIFFYAKMLNMRSKFVLIL